jgi:Tfp pilus assembly protein PilX
VNRGERGESGAILILALVYIVVVSVIVLAMSSWATNDLKNTTVFTNVNSTNYAATSATDVAIQSIRYNPIPSATPGGGSPTPYAECWVPTSGTVSQLTVDNVNIEEWCSTTENLASPQTRVVTLDACVGSGAASVCSSPWLVAVVAFNDYPPGGQPLLPTQCNLMAQKTCGEGVTIQSWTWN